MGQTATASTTTPPALANEVTYFEGQFVPASQAVVSVKNNAFLYGTSLFEGIRGYYLPEQKAISIFRLREHFERLLQNSRMFYLTPPQTLDDCCDITVDLIKRNAPQTDVYIRPTLYNASEQIAPSLYGGVPQLCIWIKPLGEYLDLTKGLNVCVSNWRRVDDNAIPPRAKAGGAYMNSALAVADARRMGFDDAIVLTHEGMVSEGSAMNLFLVKNGVLVTPAKSENILEGITRDAIITLARQELGLKTEERGVDRSELYVADEAFFCGTGAQVCPISHIDTRPIGTGQPGELTQKLQKLYFEVVKNQHAPYSGWCTVVNV
jgi:branched-chain amino acid aminotransferase